MEQYPPTLDIRFTKDHVMEVVKDKYQLNAYLLGKIFSVTRDGVESDSDSSSSDENYSLFESSDEEFSQEREIDDPSKPTQDASTAQAQQRGNRYPMQRTQYKVNMSVTRSALAKEASDLRNKQLESKQQYDDEINKQNEQEEEGDKLEKYEKALDMDLINQNPELQEVYQYYQVKFV